MKVDMDTESNEHQVEGQLFVVATPIGNLKDISQRALEVLESVDIIAAEDTRTSQKLLQHYQIKKHMLSYHDHNEQHTSKYILELLRSGKNIALISDAGSPLISDPGFELVRLLREKNIRITPIPGACSPITAIMASGISAYSFSFLGFLPRNGQKRKVALQEILTSSRTMIFMESPKRLLATLAELDSLFSSNRQLCIAREMTKLYETFLNGTCQELIEAFPDQNVRGEIVIVVAAQEAPATLSNEDIMLTLSQTDLTQAPPSAMAKKIASQLGSHKSRIYPLLLEHMKKDR
ncbi:MAG: 16S rRNA (cytidine(1402)-2'-O)-methyltransferase [Mariprofundaceae bacterium]|nr:16S rRNA (cytidine(1402)-2'-O)-methyltransferase [Mariprofundaceae bacterium]